MSRLLSQAESLTGTGSEGAKDQRNDQINDKKKERRKDRMNLPSMSTTSIFQVKNVRIKRLIYNQPTFRSDCNLHELR